LFKAYIVGKEFVLCWFALFVILEELFEFLQLKFVFHRHYAGDVVYSINGFLDKNKDTLFQDFKRLLYNSSNRIISDMWPEGAMDITKVKN